MSHRVVTVVDAGIGNLYSVGRALERCGARVEFASDPRAVDDARWLVLPGVGAFENGMRGLRERDLVDAIRRYAASGRPLLGICLGMQMLATRSEEFGEHEGLGLIPGQVRAVPPTDVQGRPHKIPHIGWSSLVRPPGIAWDNSVLHHIPEGSAVYLVHSFAVVPDDPRHRLADCVYGGHRITATIQDGAITGCQFHPEKSGEVGLRLLADFLANDEGRA